MTKRIPLYTKEENTNDLETSETTDEENEIVFISDDITLSPELVAQLARFHKNAQFRYKTKLQSNYRTDFRVNSSPECS